MPSVTPPSQPLNFLQVFDRAIHDREIRLALLVALFLTLTALVLVVAFGGPFALGFLVGPIAGRGLYTWRRSRHDSRTAGQDDHLPEAHPAKPITPAPEEEP